MTRLTFSVALLRGVLLISSACLSCTSLQARAARNAPIVPARATVAILETTDLHTHVQGYDYFRLADDSGFGLDRTATLIHQARAEFPNTVLVDAGDTIEGTALADFQAQVSPPDCKTPIAIFKAMNALRYDAATVGNHEFNYGLDWLARASGKKAGFNQGLLDGKPPVLVKPCAGPDFPLVLANVVGKKSQRLLYPPYVILKRTVQATDADGKTVQRTLRVGLIGFTPPQIMQWDKRWLDGKLATVGTLEAARRYVPQMRKAGADLVLVISHGGLDASTYRPGMENANYHLLREVPGIDALLMGHSHQVFPDANSKSAGFNAPGVDKTKGLVHGIPAVMAGFWGKYLGVIKLELQHDGRRWHVDTAATQVQARSTRKPDGQFVEADPAISRLISSEHEQTKAYVSTPIGHTDFAMSSYFTDVGDVSAIQTVNLAQADFVTRHVRENLPDLAHIPVISLSAPFKNGFAGTGDYTDIAQGALGINHAADLYPYPNTLEAVKITGADLKAWLEASARRFHRIDPLKTETQELIASFPGYNFDMLTSPDFSYEIDVSQPVGSRIKQLRFKGQSVDDSMRFIVATNNYRASGRAIAALDGSSTIFTSTQTNRDVVVNFIRATKNLTRAEHGSERSWTFSPIKTSGPVVFHAPPAKVDKAIAAGLNNVQQLLADDGLGKGMALYELRFAH